MQVTIDAATSQLSTLIDAAQAGEDVVILRGSVPVARIAPIRRGPFVIGILEGAVPPGGPDFFGPLDEDELAAWEGR